MRKKPGDIYSSLISYFNPALPLGEEIYNPPLLEGRGKAPAEPLLTAGVADRQLYLTVWEQCRSPPLAVTHTARMCNLSLKTHKWVVTGEIIITETCGSQI